MHYYFFFLLMGRAISCCPHEVPSDPDVVCDDAGQPYLLDTLVGLHFAIHEPRRSNFIHSRGKLVSEPLLESLKLNKPLRSH